jgi:hypothetical protein
MPVGIWEVTRLILYSGSSRLSTPSEKTFKIVISKNQYSPQISLADEHRMYERYVTEGVKKGIVKKPKQIQAHKKRELMKQNTSHNMPFFFY